MERLMELSQTEIKLAFVASCIEGTARALGKSYLEIFERMRKFQAISQQESYQANTYHNTCQNTISHLAYDDRKYATDSPEIQEIILSHCIGQIAAELSKRLNISPVRALELFYASNTCKALHDKSTGLYLYGNLYIVDEFMREKEY